MWSLAVEEQFYLLLPIVFLLSKKTTRLLAVLLPIIGLCAISRFIMSHDFTMSFFNGSHSFACFDALALGVLTALSVPYFSRPLAVPFIVGGILLAIAGCISYEPTAAPTMQALGACIFMLGAQARNDLFGRGWLPSHALGSSATKCICCILSFWEVLGRFVSPDLMQPWAGQWLDFIFTCHGDFCGSDPRFVYGTCQSQDEKSFSANRKTDLSPRGFRRLPSKPAQRYIGEQAKLLRREEHF